MARTGAKRRSEPGRARFLFGCVPIICGEWMGHDCCRPPQLRFVGLQYLFSLIPKVTLLTQLHLGLLHFRPALRGFEFRSLRSPTSDLSNLMGLFDALWQNSTSVPWRGNVGEGEKTLPHRIKNVEKWKHVAFLRAETLKKCTLSLTISTE